MQGWGSHLECMSVLILLCICCTGTEVHTTGEPGVLAHWSLYHACVEAVYELGEYNCTSVSGVQYASVCVFPIWSPCECIEQVEWHRNIVFALAVSVHHGHKMYCGVVNADGCSGQCIHSCGLHNARLLSRAVESLKACVESSALFRWSKQRCQVCRRHRRVYVEPVSRASELAVHKYGCV